LYNLCILTGRELERVGECHKLWQAATEVFEQMHDVWSDVNGDEYTRLHVSLLSRLCSLSQDRTALYDITRSERASFARRKAMPATPSSSEAEQSEEVGNSAQENNAEKAQSSSAL
jgi:hypothetical protein